MNNITNLFPWPFSICYATVTFLFNVLKSTAARHALLIKRIDAEASLIDTTIEKEK